MKGYLIGSGWVTAAGIGRDRRGDRFAMPLGPLPAVARRDIFDEPYPRFGRLDDFCRLGLAGVALALTDAGLDQWTAKRNIGVLAATTCGCLGTDLAYFDTVLPEGGALASPNLFAYTLSNTFLGEAAIRFGLTGSTMVLNDSDPAAFTALRLALESLAWGESPLMLAGVCDLPRPAGFGDAGESGPGAIFLALAAEKPESGRCQAEIALEAAGNIFVNGLAVDRWPDLVRACLQIEKE